MAKLGGTRYDKLQRGRTDASTQFTYSSGIPNTPRAILTATSILSTTSATFTTIADMTLTPAPGTYFISFQGAASTDGVSAAGEWAIFNNSTQLTETTVNISTTTVLVGIITMSTCAIKGSVSAQTVLQLDGATPISIRFRRSVTGGTVFLGNRSLAFIRLGP